MADEAARSYVEGRLEYDPEEPEKCFINNIPGHIISRYNKAEYDKNNGGRNLTLDYKWRP